MTIERISTDHPDLSVVLGELADDQLVRVVGLLEAADAELVAAAADLNERAAEADFATEGVVLESEVSGQASINGKVGNAPDTLAFWAELRPKNFYGSEARPWQPGRPPLVMDTDAWDVEGGVYVRFRTRVSGRPYTIQEQVNDFDERRHETVEEAAAAFHKLCVELADLARSREPTVPAWHPEEPAES